MKHSIQIIGLAMLLLVAFPSLSFAQVIDHPTVFPTLMDGTIVYPTQSAETSAPQAQAQSTTQELEAAWQEYYRSWNTLNEAFALVDNSWQQANSAWSDVTTNWQVIGNSWAIVTSDWQQLDQARALVSSTLAIALTDSETRLTQNSYVRSGFQSITRTIDTTARPQQATGGTQADLDNAWNSLNSGWNTVNAAWAELDGVWAELSNAQSEITTSWTFVDSAFQQISTAFSAVDNAWAQTE